MLADKSEFVSPPDKWDDFEFLRDLERRFGSDVGAHLAELTEEERSRLELLAAKMKEKFSWRKF
jgi:hypothetical protein